MIQQQKVEKHHHRTYFNELRQHGERALNSLEELENKFKSIYKNANQLKPIIKSYRVIINNLCLELKKQDMPTIAKTITKMFEDIIDIVDSFLYGKLLPPLEVLIQNDHWDVDSFLNKKINKITEIALDNIDDVVHTQNKAETELVEVMESLNRQLSSIDAVNCQDIHYANFQELILEQIQKINKKGQHRRQLVEKGQLKLRNIIVKILQTQKSLRKKFGIKIIGQVAHQQTQTLQPFSVSMPDFKFPKTRVAIKLDEKQKTSFQQQKQMLQMKLDHFQIQIMEKDLDLSKILAELQTTKQLLKNNEEQLNKINKKKTKDIVKPIKILHIQSRTIDLFIQIIVSEKMIDIVEVKKSKRTSKISPQNRYSSAQKNFAASRMSSKQQVFLRKSKITTARADTAHSMRLSSPVYKQIKQQAIQSERIIQDVQLMHSSNLINTRQQDQIIQSPNPILGEVLKTQAIISPINKHGIKITNSQINNYIKVKKFRGGFSQNRYRKRSKQIKATKIQFKIHTEQQQRQKSRYKYFSSSHFGNMFSQQKNNQKIKYKHTTRVQQVNQIKQKPLIFQEKDLQLFGGKQGAQKFQLLKIKDTSLIKSKSQASVSKLINNNDDKQNSDIPSQNKSIQKWILQLFRYLRNTKRQSIKKYYKIVNFLRFPYSQIHSKLEMWEIKMQHSDMGFKQLKNIIMKILGHHEDCSQGKTKTYCHHFISVFQKIGFPIK